MISKGEHVRAEIAKGKTPGHGCHWPGGCPEITAAAQYCCRKHWYKIPLGLRNKIWAAYRISQETSKTPTRRYIDIVREIETWYRDTYMMGL